MSPFLLRRWLDMIHVPILIVNEDLTYQSGYQTNTSSHLLRTRTFSTQKKRSRLRQFTQEPGPPPRTTPNGETDRIRPRPQTHIPCFGIRAITQRHAGSSNAGPRVHCRCPSRILSRESTSIALGSGLTNLGEGQTVCVSLFCDVRRFLFGGFVGLGTYRR